ncbi:choline/ethanolamine kinase family protein [Aestuariivirga litoralis]|uniref:choline/ethanolamine kinase family protein n=1 Tax=Aestuariivirga litoralis TaxID=2650924 RepID=UPI0018C53E95|nr:choline/ethanolamine kinase family protein [Aestuariivirga litoralis]MBG1233052.1 phosphotransferase [Aestuariivirga litoralis]
MSDHMTRLHSLPIWQGALEVEPLSGGVSNHGFKVKDQSSTYVARFGDDYPFHQVSRAREAIASRAAFEAGLSPELVYAAPGVTVLRFIEAKTYAEVDVRANWQPCVDIIKRCHHEMPRRVLGQGAIFWVFQIIRDYGATLIAKNHARAGEVASWLKVVDQLEAEQVPLPIIFGHHDLLPTNFMHDGKRIWLIDWEYGAFGTAMFDLANIAAANSFDDNLEAQMLERYFEGKPDEALARAFSAMKVGAALREATWGMISELFLNAPGVDYVAYAAEYLGRYEAALSNHRSRF